MYVNIDYIKCKLDEPLYPIDNPKRAKGNFDWVQSTPYADIYFGHNNSDKFSHVLSGKHLDRVREFRTDDEFIGNLLDGEAQFTRLDIAVTLEGNHVEDFWNSCSTGIGALCEQGYERDLLSKTDGFETVYISNPKDRAKKGLFRVYRHDLKHGGESMLTRFELEIGNRRAGSAARKINEGSDMAAVMGSYLNFPDFAMWGDITSGVCKTPHRGDAARDDDREGMEKASRWRWLHTQVAPALGRAIAQSVLDGYDHSDYIEFKRIVKREHDSYLRDMIQCLQSNNPQT